MAIEGIIAWAATSNAKGGMSLARSAIRCCCKKASALWIKEGACACSPRDDSNLAATSLRRPTRAQDRYQVHSETVRLDNTDIHFGVVVCRGSRGILNQALGRCRAHV